MINTATQFNFAPVEGAKYLFDYSKILHDINRLVDSEPRRFLHLMRTFCQDDLFFLLYFVLRVPVNHPWLVDRIKEVQEENDRTLDLWSREFFKSTIITYGLNIQEILRDPNSRIGIFSHTKSLAKAFLFRIKSTFESNDILKTVFPDILYDNPEYESPRWSLDDGICVKRPTIFQEMTVEAWGLVDGQPTGKHFSVLNYDDVVTEKTVTTPAQLEKIDDGFKMSLNLGTNDGKKRVLGTIYHFNDQHIKIRQQTDADGNPMWKERKYPCYDEDGNPILLSKKQLETKRVDMGPKVFATQMLLNPNADSNETFKQEWVQYWRKLPEPMNMYILCDPASKKKTDSDYTVMAVIGLDYLDNYYLVDFIRKRLNLRERWLHLKEMVQLHPTALGVYYEEYAMQSDIEYFEECKRREGINFSIEKVAGPQSKNARIERLQPRFAAERFYIPYGLIVDGVDMIKTFLEEEYLLYPYCPHKDMLDCISRIYDINPTRPQFYPEGQTSKDRYKQARQRRGTWMAA